MAQAVDACGELALRHGQEHIVLDQGRAAPEVRIGRMLGLQAAQLAQPGLFAEAGPGRVACVQGQLDGHAVAAGVELLRVLLFDGQLLGVAVGLGGHVQCRPLLRRVARAVFQLRQALPGRSAQRQPFYRGLQGGQRQQVAQGLGDGLACIVQRG